MYFYRTTKFIYHRGLCRFDYACSNISPIITEEVGEELVRTYVETRNIGDDPCASEKRIIATTRQLERLIRLSKAHARMRFPEFADLMIKVEIQKVKSGK